MSDPTIAKDQFTARVAALHSALCDIHSEISALMDDIGGDAGRTEWRTLHTVMVTTGVASVTLYDNFDIGQLNRPSVFATDEEEEWITQLTKGVSEK
jgi:hypothetical protein